MNAAESTALEVFATPSPRRMDQRAAADTFLSQLLDDPWNVDKWKEVSNRRNLRHELRVVDHTFPANWRRSNLEGASVKHPLAYDLLDLGGRVRLLVIAEELLRLIEGARW